MAPVTLMRRNIVLAAFVALALMVLLYTRSPFDTDRLKNIIPTQSNPFVANSKSEKPGTPDNKIDDLQVGNNSNNFDSQARISQLHFLIPASRANLQLCYNLASAAVNRYPVPMLLGWNGQGEFDAAITHLAKLRTIKRYLDSLDPEKDDDLGIIVDGYDIIHQLPAEVIIERYFDAARKADAHLAERMGISIGELHSRDMRQSVFWGPDKVCWPPDPRAARCWAAPASFLAENAFGPDRGPDEFFSEDPRWLNSGTVMGPIGDMRKVVDATMDEIAATYDIDFWQSDSDQYYLSNVWGRQEYWRSKKIANGSEVQGGPFDRIIPEKWSDLQDTELHMAIEYESSLFQPKAGNEPFMGHLQYGDKDYSSLVNLDMFGQGEGFTPYRVHMPSSIRTALMKLYDSVPDVHPGASAENWIRMVHLGTNFVTRQIYGLWHCTGPKEFIDGEYPKMWFYPFVRSLLKQSVLSSQRGDLISSQLIDGRKWIAKSSYPKVGDLEDEYGGAWSDEVAGGKFVPWKDLCGQHEGILFWGQQATGML